MVSKNHGYKWFAVVVFTLSRLEHPEKLGLLRSGLRSLVKSAVWLRSGLRFQVKSGGNSIFKNEVFFKDPECVNSRNARPSAGYTYWPCSNERV